MDHTVLVTGGTGPLGREVVRRLREAGRDVRVASRRAAPTSTDPAGWATVDYPSGAGLLAALRGVDTVILCAGGFGRTERRNIETVLEAAAGRPEKPYVVYISIVGVDRIPLGHYRAKLAAERALRASGLPFSIQRVTQFHSLVARLISTLAKLPVVLVPKGVPNQPIDVSVVADRLVELALGPPAGRVDDVGGPEVHSLAELARTYLTAMGRSRRVVEISLPLRTVRALRDGAGITPGHAIPGPTFEHYLAVAR